MYALQKNIYRQNMVFAQWKGYKKSVGISIKLKWIITLETDVEYDSPGDEEVESVYSFLHSIDNMKSILSNADKHILMKLIVRFKWLKANQIQWIFRSIFLGINIKTFL